MATMATQKPLAVVTGASSGIGLELARQFAQHGFDLLVCAEDDGIRDVVPTLAAEGARVQAIQVDLATRDGVEKLYAHIVATARPLDAIAINAGVGVGGDFTRETRLEDELRMIQLNVVSTVHLAKLVARDMVARKRGRILITASIAAIMPAPLEAVYGATKAFDLSFAASLRSELDDTGVTVTALMPGPTDTNFFHRAGMDDTKAIEASKANDPADVARQGFDALMAGRDRIIAASSLKTRVQGHMARLLPESLKAAQHKKLAQHPSGPRGSKH